MKATIQVEDPRGENISPMDEKTKTADCILDVWLFNEWIHISEEDSSMDAEGTNVDLLSLVQEFVTDYENDVVRVQNEKGNKAAADEADERIPLLLQTPAAKRFISYEPALGPVDFAPYLMPSSQLPGKHVQLSPGNWIVDADGAHLMWRGLDQIIVGGESGNGARPLNVQWARSVVQQCKAADVACFMKQMGGKPQTRNDQVADVWQYADGSDMDTVEGPDHPEYRYQGGTVTLKLKDRKGGSMEEWPEDLRVREFPK